MKGLNLILFALAIFVMVESSMVEIIDITDNDLEQNYSNQNDGADVDESRTEFGLILNSQAKKATQNFLNQMPCGWPEYGIPPLAPYTNANFEIQFNKSTAYAFAQLLRFRLDGLNDVDIRKLKISYTLKKTVKFHINFRRIRAVARQLNIDSMIDLLRQLGVAVRYEGNGPLDFALDNLSLEGKFKYKMPLIFGSAKIYDFQCVLRLGNVHSHIGGVLGNGGINSLINQELEKSILEIIDKYQNEISSLIERNFVPRVNAVLRGKKIWSLIGSVGPSKGVCDPDPEPWHGL